MTGLLLLVYFRVTERVSKSSKPLLYQVIPLIDTLTGQLENAAANIQLMHPVQNAAARGLRMLHKYYSKTDESSMYRVAMSKWPAHSILCNFL